MKLNKRRLLIALAGLLTLFLLIAVIGVGLIMQPVRVHFPDEPDAVQAPDATTVLGLVLRAKAWEEYPLYNGGIGVMVALAFAAAAGTSYIIGIVGRDMENEESHEENSEEDYAI